MLRASRTDFAAVCRILGGLCRAAGVAPRSIETRPASRVRFTIVGVMRVTRPRGLLLGALHAATGTRRRNCCDRLRRQPRKWASPKPRRSARFRNGKGWSFSHECRLMDADIQVVGLGLVQRVGRVQRGRTSEACRVARGLLVPVSGICVYRCVSAAVSCFGTRAVGTTRP